LLGPEVEKYGPNVKVSVIAVILGILFCTPVWFGAKDANSRTGWAIFFAVAGFFVVLVAGVLSSRATLHVDGISFRSIFGEKEMRWVEVERFRYGSHEVQAQHIPLGTFYQIKLIDQHGSKLSVGDRVGNAAQLAQKINELTFDSLLEKASERLRTGADLDFGAIHFRPSMGLTIHRWYGDKQIPWQGIASCHLDERKFYIKRVGKMRPLTISLERLWNASVFLALVTRTLSPSSSRRS
jgi:uncharacterized protein DUF6585